MPDNASQGTLEDLLLEAGEKVYPNLFHSARLYTASASEGKDLNQKDLEEFCKTTGLNKATAAAMASILKPGKSIQVSIQDNRWLNDESLQLSRISAFKGFLDELLA